MAARDTSPSKLTPPSPGTVAEPPGPRSGGASLAWKLPLLLGGLLLLVVGSYGWTAYAEVRRTATANAVQRLRIVTEQLADLSAANAQPRLMTLRAVAANPAVIEAVRGGDTAAAAAYLRNAVPGTDSLHAGWELWTDGEDRRLATGRPSTADDLVHLHPAAATALRTDSIRSSPLYPSGGRAYAWTVAPVSQGGIRLGYLAERRRLADAQRTARRIRQLTGQDVTVHFTSRTAGTWVTLNGRPVEPPFALAGLGPTFTVRTAGDTLLYGAQASIRGTPHVIVLTLPESAVLARSSAFLRRVVASGALVLLVGAIGAGLLSRHVTHPLRRITHAAEAVAAGDYRPRVTVDRGDELGRLAATFNAMARRIGESHTELAHRVEQSTALATQLERRNHELRAAQEETLRAVTRTQRLQQVTAALAGALEFDRVIAVILRAGREAADASACDVFVVNTERTALTLVRPASAPPDAHATARALALDAPVPAAEAARTGEAVYAVAPHGVAVEQASDAAAEVALPLESRGRTIGALRLRFAGPTAFDDETRAFLAAFAQQCAQALDRALLYDAAVHARNAAEQARHAAQAANQAKSAFLAMMSHELRTPLNAIGGYTELLELGIRGPVTEAQREDLVRIRRSQQHLLSIINDILNLSRIEAGQVVVRPTDVRVEDLLGELEALSGPQLAAKGLRYQVTGCTEGLMLRADPEKLSQVLLNLVSNAISFTEAGGTITAACSADADTVRLSVTDTGIGIPADKLDAIFEPFVQVDSGLTRRTGGTGLGLSISRNLMNAMGGRITVESVLGRGSTFTVTLPRVAPTATSPEPRGLHRVSGAARGDRGGASDAV